MEQIRLQTREFTSAEDARARRIIQESLDESLIVEAAAGTGKTTQLVNRLVAVLGQGRARVHQVVAVTFTRKAAGELKLRLRQELENAREGAQDDTLRSHLEAAIASLEEARIGTIHSFCAELLRERPVEARVDPAFEELSEEEAPRLYEQAYKSWIQAELNSMPEALRRTLARLATWRSWPPVSALDRIRDAGWNFIEWRDFSQPWRRDPFDRRAEIDRLVEIVSIVAEMSARCRYQNDYLRKSLTPTRVFKQSVEKGESLHPRDYDGLEAKLLDVLRDVKREKRQGRGGFAEGITRDQALKARARLLEELELFRTKADADLAVLMQARFQSLVDRYENLKRRRGALDFVDLLLKVRGVVRDDPDVRRHLQDRFTHIFVDEFQDTDPLQAEILMLLSADDPNQTDWRRVRVTPGKLFLVGDPKQSIYRFRRADVQLYQEVKKVLTGAGVRILNLSLNFRSLQPVLESVNAAFQESINGDPDSGQPDYVPLLERFAASQEHPSVIALPVPKPYGYYGVAMYKIEECLPDTVAAFVDWLLGESGWQVRDPEDPSRQIPLEPRHVCLLFRRFMSWGKDMTRAYVRALDARGVTHLLVGSRSFHQREEVETVRAAMTAVEWPDDELSVFATLKGSLFAIPDSLLLRFRLEIGALHPFRTLDEEIGPEFEPIREALVFLAELHRRRNQRPVVETANRILRFTRAHAGFALRPAGDQVLANVQRICDMARHFEMSGGISFRGFVERLHEEAEKARSSESPVLEEGADGVRMMTLHSAKGLEFPVVVLVDVTANLASREPDKFVDLERNLCATRILGWSPWELIEQAEREHRRDQAEGIRIAYVAATRARDILVVPAVGDGPLEGCWTSPLNDAIFPSDESRRNPAPASRLGCPPFGESSVLQDKPRALEGLDTSVKPGLHRPRKGTHSVVWWDPATLDLEVEGDFGLRQEEVLAEDPGGAAAEEGRRQYQEWERLRAEAVERGRDPSFSPFTATQAADWPQEEDFEIEIEILDRPFGRPSGRRFGTLVHTLLRDVALTADAASVEQMASFHGRAVNATRNETLAARDAVVAVLGHPLLDQARRAQSVHREFPVLLNLEDGRTLEGNIDLAFLLDDVWTVVEFKTDSDMDSAREKHERQIRWYLAAIARLTGRPVQGRLLGI